MDADKKQLEGAWQKATPHSMVWEHVAVMEQLIAEMRTEKKEETIRRKSALCLHAAVLTVETFLNIYFGLLLREDTYAGCRHPTEKILIPERVLIIR